MDKIAEVTFEAKFAQLVENQLNAQLPSFAKYKVGFQLLDKADDETRAVGASAYLVNGVWAFVPAVFDHGDINGSEMMFVKAMRLFVPSADNWLNAIKDQGKDVLSLGQMTDRPRFRGPQFRPEDVPLDEALFTANDKQAQAQDYTGNVLVDEETRAAIMAQATGHWDLTLPQQLMTMPKEAAALFCNTFMQNPDFANAVLAFYPPEMLSHVVGHLQKQAKDDEATVALPVPEEVTIIDTMTHPALPKLDLKEKKLFFDHGVYVRDSRKDKSVLFHNKISPRAFSNPTHSGMYEVLMADGTLTPCLLMFDITGAHACPDGCCSVPPWAINRTGKMSVPEIGHDTAVVNLKQPFYYTLRKSSDLFVRPVSSQSIRDMPEYKALKGKVGMLARKRSLATILGRTGNDQASTVLFAQPDGKGCIVEVSREWLDNKPDPQGFLRLKPVFTDKDGRLTKTISAVVIPNNVRMFTEMPRRMRTDMAFGNLDCVKEVLMKEAGVEPLRVFRTSGGYNIESVKGRFQGLDKAAAVSHLALKEGIGGGQCVAVVEEASRLMQSKDSAEYLIKYADGYPDRQLPWMEGTPYTKEERGAITNTTRPNVNTLFPEQATQQAVQAAKDGNQQVFDLHILQGLVEAADVTELKKDFLVDLMKGMDRAGRLLFVLYWHSDKFEEQYGKDDLQRLQDKLKQVFKLTGDLVLFLKEKMPAGSGGPEALIGDLSENIGVESPTNT